MLKKIFSISLIILGSFLEIYYYQFRFSNDGIEQWLAIVIGVALTLFLCLAILHRKSLQTRILIVSLIIYSVLATSAGQSFSLSLYQKEIITVDIQEEYRQDQINDILYRINQIDEKYKNIQKGIEETAKTLHDRGMYRTALKVAEDRQHELNTERKILQDELSDLRMNAITHKDVKEVKTNIYEFYNNLTGVISVEWLQFIFQTILSIFIAIMAPLGIITIQGLSDATEDLKIDNKKNTWNILIDRWININWRGIRTGKTNKILPESAFMAYANAYDQPFTKKQYLKIKKLAELSKCINNDQIMVNESNAKKQILLFLEKSNTSS